jgi:hypothetical protein
MILFGGFLSVQAQVDENEDKEKEERRRLDSLFIEEVENPKEKDLPDKVLHAEPLYIDLIRDLGARKGEHEWNVGVGLADNINYDKYTALVEYEFAPIHRLGLEIEFPFTFYLPFSGSTEEIPRSRLNSLKMAAQYTFLVSEKAKTSLAVGYLHDFEFVPFRDYGKKRFYKGNLYNPFFIAAKRWGNNFHTLVYTGPVIEQLFEENKWQSEFQINSNFHYMISGTRNFIGIEINKEVQAGKMSMVLRPQMRVGVAHNFLIGIVTGIPISRENERFSTFLRVIYEPERKGKKKH